MEKAAAEQIIESLASVGFVPEMNQSDSLREALKIYQDSYPEDAFRALNSFLQDHPQNDTARFYLALTEMSMGNYELANGRLSPLSQKDRFSLSSEAQWYLALCYLKLEGRWEEALPLLEQLSKDDSFGKRREAESLIQEMKKE